MSAKRTSLVGLVVVMMTIASVCPARADDPVGVCVRGARQYTCPDGTTIDACDDCSSSSGGGGGNGNVAKGMVKLIGGLVAVAAFPVMFAFAPAATLELWFGKGKNMFGDKAAARERWKQFEEDRKATEARGKRVAEANALLDRDPDLRDAMSSHITTKHAMQPPPGKFWWTDKPHLQPSLDFTCKQAALEYPTHMFATDPISVFANTDDMLRRCEGRYQPGILATDPGPNGRCAIDQRQCMHAKRNGQVACCAGSNPVFNAVDEKCYRDTDYRDAGRLGNDEAGRYAGGEYCPASSPSP